MLHDVYQDYGQYFYVPMTQACSLAVPVTLGCSWNRCLYCDLNHNQTFRFLGFTDIEKKLEALKAHYSQSRRPVERIVLAGGNPFCLDAKTLIRIAQLVKASFPQVKTISSFARVDDVLRKSPEELLELKNHGYGNLSLGVESGNDEILAFHKKGVTRQETQAALLALEEAGISYSTYIMLGLGGKRLSRENALDTASLLSQVNPAVICVVTLVLFKDAKLIEKVRTREFARLNVLDSIREEQLLLEHLNMRNTIFNGTHKTNALILKGKLPEQKSRLLDRISQVIINWSDRDMRSKDMAKWTRWSLE